MSRDLTGQRIAVLDGWRGISIAMVIVGHFLNFRLTSGSQEPVGIPGALAQLGVEVFFFISGFIITRIALRERETHNFSVRNFYLRRIFRIIPPFLVFVFAIAAAAAFGQIVQPGRGILFGAAFLCNTGVSCGWFMGHTWSLAVEEQFYLFFPLLFALLGPRIAVAAIVLILTSFALVVMRRILPGSASVDYGADFLAPFVFICCGCIAAYSEQRLKRVSAARIAGLLSGASMALILVLVIAPDLGLARGSPGSRALAMLDHIALPAAVSWLVASSVLRQTLWTTVLSSPILLWAGSISYSLYLWQQLFMAPVSLYSNRLLLVWPLMFVVAWCSYRFIERPFIRLGREFLIRRAPGTTSIVQQP